MNPGPTIPRPGNTHKKTPVSAPITASETAELSTLEIPVSATTVISGALAFNDFALIHHDRNVAKSQGLSDIIMNGAIRTKACPDRHETRHILCTRRYTFFHRMPQRRLYSRHSCNDRQGRTSQSDRIFRRKCSKHEKIHFCYKAGPAGYGWYRLITDPGHSCLVGGTRDNTSFL